MVLGDAALLADDSVRQLLHLSPRPPPARLFFGTGFARPSPTSKCSNRIEITRVVRKKTARWPRVPLLALFTQFNLPLSMRRRRRDRPTHERHDQRHRRDSSARSPWGAGHSSEIRYSETIAPLHLISYRAGRSFHRTRLPSPAPQKFQA